MMWVPKSNTPNMSFLVPKLRLGMHSCNAPRCEWRLGTRKVFVLEPNALALEVFWSPTL